MENAELTTLAGQIAEENGLDGNDAADLANELHACVEHRPDYGDVPGWAIPTADPRVLVAAGQDEEGVTDGR